MQLIRQIDDSVFLIQNAPDPASTASYVQHTLFNNSLCLETFENRKMVVSLRDSWLT